MRISALFFLARFIPNLIGVISAALMTRIFEPSEYGLYALGLSISLSLNIALFEGLSLSVLRQMKFVEQAERFFGTILACFMGLSGLTFAVTAAGLLVAGSLDLVEIAVAGLILTVSGAWFELGLRVKLVELHADAYFRMSVFRSVLALLFIVATAYFTRNAAVTMIAFASSYILGSLLYRESRFSIAHLCFDRFMAKGLFTFGFPLAASLSLATLLGGTIDRWVLQGVSGAGSVGLFAAATVVAQSPIFALAGGIGPFAYSKAVTALESRDHLVVSTQLSANFVLLLGVVAPATVGIIDLSKSLAGIMVGPSYVDAVVAFTPWIAVGTAFSSIRAFYIDTAFQLASRNGYLVVSMAATVVFNAGIDILLVPKFSGMGAAIGFCAASCLGFVITTAASLRVFRLPFPVRDTLKIAFCTALMSVALHELRDVAHVSNVFVGVLAGGLVYAGALIAFDVRGLRQILLQRLIARRRPA